MKTLVDILANAAIGLFVLAISVAVVRPGWAEPYVNLILSVF